MNVPTILIALPLLSLSAICNVSALDARGPRPNILLLCIDDLRPELHCYGADYIHSPNIDRLASQGCIFQRHYVQAPTCGASRCAMLTGRYAGSSNQAIFRRAARLAKDAEVTPSMPAWFRQHGYRTVSVGKVSHHPGGRGGPNWDDRAQLEMPDSWDRHLLPAGPWMHPRGAMHGLARGEIRTNAGKMDLFQSVPGEDSIYPDGMITDEALRQLEELTTNNDAPFFLAVGIIRPHLPFGAPAKYMAPYREAKLPPIVNPTRPIGRTTWHRSGEFMKYNRWKHDPNNDAEFAIEVRKHYAACVTYADALVGRITDRLRQLDVWDNTIVVLWGDHGWHLGEHAIWGKHALFEESLRSPLIIRYPGQNALDASSNAIVESIDVFPTLCELSSLPLPSFLSGSSLVPLLGDGQLARTHGAVSYSRDRRTIRTDRHRLIAHGDGFLELYDHAIDPGESVNNAEHEPEIARELLTRLNLRRPVN